MYRQEINTVFYDTKLFYSIVSISQCGWNLELKASRNASKQRIRPIIKFDVWISILSRKKIS